MLQRLPLLLVLALPLPAPAQEAREVRHLEDSDLEALAGALGTYLDARSSTVGLEKAKGEVVTALADLREATGGADPLKYAADLAHAAWTARGYTVGKLRTGKVTSDEFERGSFDEAPMGYAYHLPKEYDPDEGAYPLILSIPDETETPAEHIRSNWTNKDVQEAAILLSPEMPEDVEGWDKVVVSGRPGGLSHILTGLRIACDSFAVDFDRVYVVGRGKGVPAAVAVGNYSPHRFAGIIGRAGDVADMGPENFGNLPTYFTGAGGKAREFQEKAKAAGFDNCTLNPAGTEKDVWHWIQSNPRTTWPSEVTVVPGDPFPTRAYWLRISPSAAAPRATGRIDRASNTVTLDAEGVSNATLFLGDALLDLDQPVKVVVNGVEVETRLERHLPSTLDMLHDGTSDAGCVYVARVSCDMTSETPIPPLADAAERDADYDDRLSDAAGNAESLWQLYEWCNANGRTARGYAVLNKILRVDPDHLEARAALGHVHSPVQWFTSQAALDRFEATQDEETARAKGFVQYKGLWIHPEERSKASKGWTKDHETGVWFSPADRKKLAAGWLLQDLEWIAPEEADRVDEGLWKVDGEWLDLTRANQRRSRVYSKWRIPSAKITLHSTADRATSLWAIQVMEQALHDLNKVFGAEPPLPLTVGLMRDEEQYDRFAFGDPDGRRAATHGARLHTIHSAFFAESAFPKVEGEREYAGMGVCYWDAFSPNGNLYGIHSARLATGLSYGEALDPSPKAVRKALSSGPGREYYESREEEKKLPAWFRWGGAVYGERYFYDRFAAEGNDPWWTRKWSLENLNNRGGLRPLAEVLECNLDPDDREDGRKLLIELGLVVAFLVDGDCEPVQEAHEKVKAGLVSGRLHANHVKALEEALLAHEAELRAFGGQ